MLGLAFFCGSMAHSLEKSMNCYDSTRPQARIALIDFREIDLTNWDEIGQQGDQKTIQEFSLKIITLHRNLYTNEMMKMSTFNNKVWDIFPNDNQELTNQAEYNMARSGLIEYEESSGSNHAQFQVDSYPITGGWVKDHKQTHVRLTEDVLLKTKQTGEKEVLLKNVECEQR